MHSHFYHPHKSLHAHASSSHYPAKVFIFVAHLKVINSSIDRKQSEGIAICVQIPLGTPSYGNVQHQNLKDLWEFHIFVYFMLVFRVLIIFWDILGKKLEKL